MSTNEKPPSRRGSTFSSATSRSRPSERGKAEYSWATNSATRAESVVESRSNSGAVMPGSIPMRSASFTVFVRLPLWPRAKPASPTER